MNESNGNGLAGKIDQLRLSIEATSSRSDERHVDICARLVALDSGLARQIERHAEVCHRLASLETGVDGVRLAQQHHGTAIASMQAVCAERAKGCGALHDDLRGKQLRQSTELNHLRGGVAEELKQLRGGVEEVSQVTALADVRRAQTMRLLRLTWGVMWKVLLVLATLGLLGTGAVEVIKLLR